MNPVSSPRAAADRVRVIAALVVLVALMSAACGSSGSGDDTSAPATGAGRGGSVRLLTHDSFSVSDAVLAGFEQRTGIKVEVVRGGDAVEVVNQAILAKRNPQGDVLFGIDNNLLTRAFDEGLFEPYESPALAGVDPSYVLDPQHRVTPIDVGDVCVNYDRSRLRADGLPVPDTLEDLADPRYRGMLVVENPATSSPGLAFLLGTRARFGEGWLDYWRALKDNGVTVADGWEQAYYSDFSGGSGEGDRPLVVSYASSPAAEVPDPSISVEDAPTGFVPATCYRQIEFAGILAGAANPDAARQLIDFLLSVPFQEDVPMRMFVYPVNTEAALPETFTKFAALATDPLELPPAEVAANRDRWIEEWTKLFSE
ncbi:thiamine ABC transporter substrate-binding protein [Rhabdothermincola sediminis]|uniref:thiamine ABC transporter substrate-binding protein n=1 Tax=Rhabdothermincola sediminis TaxID=2751370 RepID=UPI001AA0423A|nr:thiamine ABC transporter substrate-binding protein [Rhabdothermincola sediminis]